MQTIQSFDWLHFKFKFQIQIFVAIRIFKIHQHFCFLCFHSRWRFFWFQKDREITKKIFLPGQKIVSAKENFRAPAQTLPKFYLRERNGQSRAGSIAPSCPLGYTEHRIGRILPARRACHVIIQTEREGRTGEYWPVVEAVRTERSEVHTAMTEGQYSPARPEQARLVSCLLYGILAFDDACFTFYINPFPSKRFPIDE